MDLKILEIASNTKNNKIVKNFTHLAKNKNPTCGDEMEIRLIIANDKIIDFGYQSKSCIYCQASVSLLSRNSINKSTIKIKSLLSIANTFFEKENVILPKEWSAFGKIFNKKHFSRKECLILPFKTLAKALIS